MDSEESLPPAYAAWQAGTINWVGVPACQAGNGFLGFLKVLSNGTEGGGVSGINR
jgi:hypothetical protein